MQKRQLYLIALAVISGVCSMISVIALLPGATAVKVSSISYLGNRAIFLYPMLVFTAVHAVKKSKIARDEIWCVVLLLILEIFRDELTVSRGLVPSLSLISAFLAWLEMKRNNEPTIWQLWEQQT